MEKNDPGTDPEVPLDDADGLPTEVVEGSRTGLPVHPLCEALPPMAPGTFAALKEQIRVKTQRNPIRVYRGQIVDGRHRERACLELGIDPDYQEWDGDEAGLLDLVIGENVLRRNLTKSQLAAVAVEFLPHFEREARRRQATSTGGSAPQLRADLPEAEAGRARDEVAGSFGISGTLVAQALRVKQQGPPELFERVRLGEITVNAALDILKEEHRSEGAVPTTSTDADRAAAGVEQRAHHEAEQDDDDGGRNPDASEFDPVDHEEGPNDAAEQADDADAGIASFAASDDGEDGEDGADEVATHVVRSLLDMPLSGRLRDPSAYQLAARFCRTHKTSSMVAKSNLKRAGFQAEIGVPSRIVDRERLRCWRHVARLICDLAEMEDPSKWPLCRECSGTGCSERSSRPCKACEGDGFEITYRWHGDA